MLHMQMSTCERRHGQKSLDLGKKTNDAANHRRKFITAVSTHTTMAKQATQNGTIRPSDNRVAHQGKNEKLVQAGKNDPMPKNTDKPARVINI